MSNDYGIKATFPGFEVTDNRRMTATTPIPFGIGADTFGTSLPDFSTTLFSSAFFVYKVIATGTVSQAIAQTTAPPSGHIDTITIAHGLSYAPMVSMFWSPDGANWFANNSDSQGTTTGQPQGFGLVGSDATNLYIYVSSSHLAAYTFQARWVIYAEPGS